MEKPAFVANTTVLSNFAAVEREDLLRKVLGEDLVSVVEVMEELQRGETKGLVPQRNWSWLRVLKVETSQERALFESLRQRLGTGEAACLSLAITRGFKILTDDLDARRLAQQRGLAVSGTLGVLVEAVREGHLSREEGNRLLLKMKEAGYFSPYESLDELL